MYVYIYIYIWVCDCECKCDPHKLGHIISVYATMAYYGYISTEVEPHGLWVLGQLWELTRIVLGAAWGGQCHPQQNQFAIQNGHEVVPNLRKYCRYRYPWKWDETVIFHNNNRQTHKSIQKWTIFSTIYEKSIDIKKLGVCVCGKIASRYFSEYFQI
jgi:hypothetical protein